MAPAEVANQVELSERKLATALQRLAEVGAVEVLAGGEVELAADTDLDQASSEAASEQAHHQEVRREKLRCMQEYADSSARRLKSSYAISATNSLALAEIATTATVPQPARSTSLLGVPARSCLSSINCCG